MTPPAKYSYEEVQQVREMAQAGTPIKEIQQVIPMPASYISHIKHGKIRVKR